MVAAPIVASVRAAGQDHGGRHAEGQEACGGRGGQRGVAALAVRDDLDGVGGADVAAVADARLLAGRVEHEQHLRAERDEACGAGAGEPERRAVVAGLDEDVVRGPRADVARQDDRVGLGADEQDRDRGADADEPDRARADDGGGVDVVDGLDRDAAAGVDRHAGSDVGQRHVVQQPGRVVRVEVLAQQVGGRAGAGDDAVDLRDRAGGGAGDLGDGAGRDRPQQLGRKVGEGDLPGDQARHGVAVDELVHVAEDGPGLVDRGGELARVDRVGRCRGSRRSVVA